MPDTRDASDDQAFLAQIFAAALRARRAVAARSDEEGLPAQALRALIDNLPEEARPGHWEHSFGLGDNQVVVVQQTSDGPASGALGRTVREAAEAAGADTPASDDLLVSASTSESAERDPLDDVSAAVDRMRRLPF